MELTEIRKESLGVVEQVNSVLSELAERASSILGYSVLAKQTGTTAVQVELTPLQQALKDLDIEILRVSDVLAYQKEHMIAETVRMVQEWVEQASAKDRLRSYDGFSGVAWSRVKISEYIQPVPEFVLAKAIQIKERVPECELWIESLTHDPFLVVGIPDGRPYYDPTELYYVEVWAEPKFEGMLRGQAGQPSGTTNDIPF